MRTRAASARRIAGSVGSGGGPAHAGGTGLFFPPPAGLAEPPVLEEGEADHGYHRVVVQPGPRAPLKVVELALPRGGSYLRPMVRSRNENRPCLASEAGAGKLNSAGVVTR